MRIKMGANVIIEAEIPFQILQKFTMNWKINEHAVIQVKGILNSHVYEEKYKQDYAGTDIKILVLESDLDEKVIFNGLVTTVDYISSYGIESIFVEAKSATIQLDNQQLSCSFQNQSETYVNVMKELLFESKGNVISTVESKKIDKPIICYKETAWEFIKRVASAQNKYIIPDVVTGKVNFWYGMRKGVEIKDKETILCTSFKIKKDYSQGEQGRIIENYIMKSTKTYSLGDWININGQSFIIYQKKVQLEKAELLFEYILSKEQNIKVDKYYNEKFTGLSLSGSVESTKNEYIEIKYKIDGKKSDCFYPWMPETGNCMYAIPENNSVIAIQFINHDEGEGIAVRCLDFSDSSKRKENVKTLEIPEDGKLILQEDKLEVIKRNNFIKIADNSIIKIDGENIEIRGDGKVKIQAPIITLNAMNEIKAVAEGS